MLASAACVSPYSPAVLCFLSALGRLPARLAPSGPSFGPGLPAAGSAKKDHTHHAARRSRRALTLVEKVLASTRPGDLVTW